MTKYTGQTKKEILVIMKRDVKRDITARLSNIARAKTEVERCQIEISVLEDTLDIIEKKIELENITSKKDYKIYKYSKDYFKFIDMFCKRKGIVDIADIREFTSFLNDNMETVNTDEVEKVYKRYIHLVELNGCI